MDICNMPVRWMGDISNPPARRGRYVSKTIPGGMDPSEARLKSAVETELPLSGKVVDCQAQERP